MRDYVVPLRLALPLQDGGGVERRGASQLLMRGRHRNEGVPALAGEESRLDAVHRGGVRPPTETAEEEAGVYLLGDGRTGRPERGCGGARSARGGGMACLGIGR